MDISLTTLPPTYRTQNGCWNCRHRYEYLDHDTTTVNGDYYCTVDGTERPHSGSVALEPAEGFDAEKWSKWAITHYVQPAGICDQWEVNLWTKDNEGG